MPCPIDHSNLKDLKTTEPLPVRMRGLPVDDRGYVVPWFVAWITRQYEVFPDGRGGRLIQMGEPIEVIWYACGGPASREQVQASIDSGLPNLEALARLENGGMEHLSRVVKRFQKCLPGGDLNVGN